MAERNEELQARIAALAGAINQHKQHQTPPATPLDFGNPPLPTRGRGSHSTRGRGRWSPYPRGGRVGYQNRTLVLNGAQTPKSPSPTVSTATTSVTEPSSGLVSARTAGQRSLMSRDTFERERKQKLDGAVAARQNTELDEKAQLKRHFQNSTTPDRHEVTVEGVRFQVQQDGSKLIRITEPATTARNTPKRCKIANVDFYRTKHGNLVRAATVKALDRTKPAKPRDQCKHFTQHGTCPYGPRCLFAHDPAKVAVCKAYLQKGSCHAGDRCDLSHELTYHRVSACTHFQRGNCINEGVCRYPHVNISPSAPVCRSFATLGYCALGEACRKRHVIECPDYANKSHCAEAKCPLPHIDHANVLRKRAHRQAKLGSEIESDLSSEDSDEEDDDADFEDVDSDDAENFTQQWDFVPLS